MDAEKFQHSHSLEDALSQLGYHGDKKVYLSNIGEPVSYRKIIKNGNYLGHICKNNFENLMTYDGFKYMLPVINFIPNKIIMELIPDIYCLNFSENYGEILFNSIYSNVVKSNKLPTYNVAIINWNNPLLDFKEIKNRFEQIAEEHPDLKESIHFYNTN